MQYEEEFTFLNLDIDENNTGSVRRIEEGFNKLNSKWILGFNATRYRYGKWIVTWIFNPITTQGPSNLSGKKEVTQYGVETNQIIKMQRASSPGNFYIEHVALKQNAAGMGGTHGWKYASSEFGDLIKTFTTQGAQGLINDVKQIVIPNSVQKHINEVNKAKAKIKNPLDNLNHFAQRQAKKSFDPLLERTFQFTKDKISIGFKATEFFIAPEAILGKAFWSLGRKTPISLGKNLRKKPKNFKKL